MTSIPHGSAGVLGVLGVGALVVAVLLVRPGSQATGQDLAGPSATPSVDAEAPPTPAELQSLALSELTMSPSGIGPLTLGRDLGPLLTAGWSAKETADGCLRLTGELTSEAVLRGWAVDGRVVSAQLELTGVLDAPLQTGLGFSLGAPLDESGNLDSTRRFVAGETPGVDVRAADWSTTRSLVSVSDLGLDGIRFVEVSTTDGRDCELTADLASPWLPSAEATVDNSSTGTRGVALLEPLTPSQFGLSLQDLSATEWAGQVATLTGSGCEVIERREDGQSLQLSIGDGSVIGERFTSGAFASVRSDIVTTPPSGEFEEVSPGRLERTLEVEVSDESSSWTLQMTSQIVRELDAAVVIDGPTIVQQSNGDPCG